MITIETIRDYYYLDIDKRIEELELEIADLHKSRHTIQVWFSNNKEIYSPRFYDDIISGEEKPIKDATSNSEKFFNIQLTNYNKLTSLYKNKRQVINNLKNKLKDNEFNFILKTINSKLGDAIISENYEFKEPSLGRFKIVKTELKKPAVNWGKSRIAKQALIDEGKIPYSKKEHEEAIAQGKEYKGIYWLEYLPSLLLVLNWEKGFSNYSRLGNIKNYSFMPSSSNKKNDMSAFIQRLMHLRRSLTDEEIHTNYKTRYDVS